MQAQNSARRELSPPWLQMHFGDPPVREEKSRIAVAAAWKSATQTRSSKAICILICCGIQIFIRRSLSW